MMNESIRMQENPFDLPNVDIPDPIDSVFPPFFAITGSFSATSTSSRPASSSALPR